MKWQLLGAALALLATAGPARAVPEMVAGRNFSQYSGDGSLDTDGDFLNEATLSANFSNRIPGDGAGAAANPYGTMYMDGSKGSTAIDVDGFPPAFGPSQAAGGSLTTNLGAPTSSGTRGSCSRATAGTPAWWGSWRRAWSSATAGRRS